MSLEIVVTNAGRAAIVNAQNTGAAPVTISHVGLSSTAVVPVPTLTALAGEIKRVSTISGEVVADDIIHLSMLDSTADAYTLRSLALYLADGTMFAIYGQAGPVLEKTSGSVAALSVDVIFADISAASLTFGDATFVNPPATTERQGVVELTTLAEALAGSDAIRALTAAAAKGAVLNWLLSQDGSGSGLDADLLDGMHASAFAQAGHTHGTMAEQNANAVAITGGAISNVATTGGTINGAAIAGGTINGTTLGAVTPAAGRFTTLQCELATLPNINLLRSGVASWSVGGFAGGGDAFGVSLNAIAPFLYLDTTGKVGVGTTNPAKKFAVSNGGANGFEIDPGEGAYTRVLSYDRVAGSYTPMILEGSEVRFLYGTGTEGAQLTSGGHLLIGRSGWSGIGKLNVEGGADFTGGSVVIGRDIGGLGVGVAPAVRLHVRSSSEVARIETTTARGAGNGFVTFFDPSGRKGYFGYGGPNDNFFLMNDLGSLNLGAAGNTRLTLDTAGNLVPSTDGLQILGWPSARFRQGHFSEFVRIGGFDAWTYGNDGSGSGLDADLLDGQQGAYYLPAASYTAPDVLAKLVTVDGSGSGLDADLLDGYHASSFDRVVEQNLSAEGGYIIYASGRKECWGTVVVGMDSYATWNLPIAHTSWCHPSFTYTGKIGVNNTGDNTMFAGFVGSPPYALRFWNAEDQTLTIYVRTIGV